MRTWRACRKGSALRRYEAPSIGRSRSGDDRLYGVALDRCSMPQNEYSRCELEHQRKVMRNVKCGKANLSNERSEVRKHLDLSCDVERCRRLVQNEEPRSGNHRHRDHCALQLAARHLVRIPLAELLRVGKAQSAKECDPFTPCQLVQHQAFANRDLADLRDEPMHGIECGRCALAT